MPTRDRPGYYVEDRFYQSHYHQALARARFLANEYRREIEVIYVPHGGRQPELAAVLHPYPGQPSYVRTVRNEARDACLSPVKDERPSLADATSPPGLVDRMLRLAREPPTLELWSDWARRRVGPPPADPGTCGEP